MGGKGAAGHSLLSNGSSLSMATHGVTKEGRVQMFFARTSE